MKPTFNQLAAGLISVILIIFLGVVFFIPSHGTDQQTIIVAIIPALSLCLNYLFSSSSSSAQKDANLNATTNSLIDNLQKSAPAKNA